MRHQYDVTQLQSRNILIRLIPNYHPWFYASSSIVNAVSLRARAYAGAIKAIRVDYVYERRKPLQILLRQTKQAAIADRERFFADYNGKNINLSTIEPTAKIVISFEGS